MKKIIKIIITFILVFSKLFQAYAEKDAWLEIPQTIKFKIDSNVCKVKHSTYEIDESNEKVVSFIDERTKKVYLPLRIICLINDYTIEWKKENQEVKLIKNDDITKLYIGLNKIVFSQDSEKISKIVELDTEPVIYQERTFVSLETIAELMNYCTYFNNETKEIILLSKTLVELSDYYLEEFALGVNDERQFRKLNIISGLFYPNIEFTTRAYVNFSEECNEEEIYTILGENVTIEGTNELTGSYYVDFYSIDNMRKSIIRLNELDCVDYADPI